MKPLKITIALLIFTKGVSFSQSSITHGAKSPIVGAKAKVEYINNNSVKLSIPPTLATYLTGLLLANKVKSDTADINNALTTWIKKYKELKKAVNLTNDSSKKNFLLQ